MAKRVAKSRKFTEAQVREAERRFQAEFDRFMALPDAERALDAERSASLPGHRLTPAEREAVRRSEERAVARRGRGRPIKGAGSVPVNVTIERKLLGEADDAAEVLGKSRAQFIAQCLRLGLDELSKRSALVIG